MPSSCQSPTIIAVACAWRCKNREDYAAACCAAQNVQWQLGQKALASGAQGRYTKTPRTKYIIDFSTPDIPMRLEPRRKPLEEVMNWTTVASSQLPRTAPPGLDRQLTTNHEL